MFSDQRHLLSDERILWKKHRVDNINASSARTDKLITWSDLTNIARWLACDEISDSMLPSYTYKWLFSAVFKFYVRERKKYEKSHELPKG